MNYLKINEDNLYLDLAVKWKTTEHTNRFLYSATCYIIGLDFNLKICVFEHLRVTDFQKSQLRLYQYHDQSLFIDLHLMQTSRLIQFLNVHYPEGMTLIKGLRIDPEVKQFPRWILKSSIQE